MTDAQYLSFLAYTDILRHWPGLSAARDSLTQSNPLKEIGYRVDYYSSPPKLDVFLIHDFLTTILSELNSVAIQDSVSILSKTEEIGTSKALLVICYRLGNQVEDKPRMLMRMCSPEYFNLGSNAVSPDLSGELVCRSGAVDCNEEPLQHAYDGIDEIIRGLHSAKEESCNLLGAEEKHLWEYLDESVTLKEGRLPFREAIIETTL